jgi:hypothetical protein
MAVSLVVVNDLDVTRTGWRPAEADTELVVYPNAMLSGTISFQRLKSITGRHSEVLKPARDLQLSELATRN